MSKPAPVTLALIIVCVVLYIPEALGVHIGGHEINYWLCVANDSLSRPWELVTAIFAHWSIEHLAMNMISLYWLGTMIEEAHGHVKFGIVFFVSGILGNLAVVLFADPNTVAAGASGSIFGLLGAAALLFFAFRQDPGIRSQLQGLLIMLAINVVNSFIPGISMEAHFGGLAGGLICEAVILGMDRDKLTVVRQ
mgnify:CR=1 FL=1